MSNRIVILCILLVATVLAVAYKPHPYYNVGRAPYALQHETFECDKFINSLNGVNNLHISFLWNTFGTNNTCLYRLLEDPRMTSLSIALINEVCQKSKRCQPYEFLATAKFPKGIKQYDAALRRRDPALIADLHAYFAPIKQMLDERLLPQTACYLVPGLESNLSGAAHAVLNEVVRQDFPGCAIVQSGAGKRLGNSDYKESHGDRPSVSRPCIVNNDGTDVTFKQRKSKYGSNTLNNIPKYVKNYGNKCDVVYLWSTEDNCKPSPSSKLPQRSRVCRAGIVDDLLGNEIRKAQAGY